MAAAKKRTVSRRWNHRFSEVALVQPIQPRQVPFSPAGMSICQGGFTCTVQQADAKVGGMHRASFTNFTTGKSHSFGGKYLELKPNELIRYTDKFDDPNLPDEMKVTVTLK